MPNPIGNVTQRVRSIETHPSSVPMGDSARTVHVVAGAALGILSGVLAWRTGAEILGSSTEVPDGIGVVLSSSALKTAGASAVSGAASLVALTRGVDAIPSFDRTSPDSRKKASLWAGLGVAAGVLGFVVSSDTPSTAESSDPTTVPTTVPAEVAAPLSTEASDTGAIVETTTTAVGAGAVIVETPVDAFGAGCELRFADDGDGFIQGDQETIARFQASANQADFGPFVVNGTFSEADLAEGGPVDVFKQTAIAQLGDAYVPGPEGQVTLQMCDLLSIEIRDNDPNTPPIPAFVTVETTP